MNQIREIRYKHKLTQTEFAKKLEVSQSYVSKLEVNDIPPNNYMMIKLQEVFKVNVYKLIKSYYQWFIYWFYFLYYFWLDYI